jgi:hypothetical protein
MHGKELPSAVLRKQNVFYSVDVAIRLVQDSCLCVALRAIAVTAK